MKIGKILLLALLLSVIIASGCTEETEEEEKATTIIGQEMTMSEIKGMMSPPPIDKNAYQTRTVRFLGFSYIFGRVTKVERDPKGTIGLVTFADGEQRLLIKPNSWFSGFDEEWQEGKIHRITVHICSASRSECISDVRIVNEG
ncbi:hypothetical protein KAR26_00880 [Candidatus Parcubacteria bacterium]|nr:hypothetical protein [Candidatus Parcubacteria bacterium]